MLSALLLFGLIGSSGHITLEEHQFPSRGFAISAPSDDWDVGKGSKTDAGYLVDVSRSGSGGVVAVSVLTDSVGQKVDADAARDAAIKTVAGRDQYIEHQVLQGIDIDGLSASGVDIEWDVASIGAFRTRLWYVVDAGEAYMLKAQAPVADWDEYESEFQTFFASFKRIERTPEDETASLVSQLAAKCGSELDWAADWETAAQRAKAKGCHVLVVVRAYPGFDVPDVTRISTFMDEDLVRLLKAEVVPLRLEKGMPAPMRDSETYGMGPSTFGTGLLLCDSDGNVLADTPQHRPSAVLRWLWSELPRHAGPDRRVPHEDRFEHALERALRGEFAEVVALLDAETPGLKGAELGRAEEVRARIHMLRHEGPEALAAIDRALAADPGTGVTLACQRAEVLLRENRVEDARRALEPALADEADEAFPKALFLASTIEQYESGVLAARPLRERLVKDHSDSRWAWLAAAMLENEALLLAGGRKMRLEWPDPKVLATAAEPLAAPVPRSGMKDAERDALRWLADTQLESGEWPSLIDAGRAQGDVPNEISTAIDAIATRTLLQNGKAHRDAASKGLARLLEIDALRRANPTPPVYMDYTAWAAWAQLELIADALESELAEGEELRAFGDRLIGDLGDRVRQNGGWSYYLSGNLDGENAVEQSISFTTAAVVIGLIRARDAGIDVPDKLVEGALDCLEAMRGETGLFAYMLHYPSGFAQHGGPVGSAGRGPACELALFLGGRSSEERLGSTLELFDRYAHGLAGEVGKALMHAGEDSVGSHYPFFDYLMAARASQHVPRKQRRKLSIRVVELVLAARLADGSFQDTPITGQSFGTAAALQTLRALRD